MRAKKCPVCGWEVKDETNKVKLKDRVVVVCCEDCAKKLKENPGQYGAAR